MLHESSQERKDADIPYLIDLQLFLSRKLVVGRTSSPPSFSDEIILGSLPRNGLETCVETASKLLEDDQDLDALRIVAAKGEKLYNRTRNSAALESVKRSKGLLNEGRVGELNAFFTGKAIEEEEQELAREAMLARVSGFRPNETVFEIGKRGNDDLAATIMKTRREKINTQQQRKQAMSAANDSSDVLTAASGQGRGLESTLSGELNGNEDATALDNFGSDDDDDDVEITVSEPQRELSEHHKEGQSGQDAEFFMSYLPSSNALTEDKGYGVTSGSNEKSNGSSFVTAARNASMNLTQDESGAFGKPSRMRWDKRSKKYVNRTNDEDGSRGKKMIRGESGQKIAASLRSGRFDAWRKAHKVSHVPRVGEAEAAGRTGDMGGGKRFKHKADRAPKEADRWRDDYHKQRKKVAEAKEKRQGKYRDGAGAKSELKGVDDVRKSRQLKEKRKEKNARPSKKRKM